MLIQPIDYFLVVWFALAAASTGYVAWDQYLNNPEPAVMKWGFILVTLYMGPLGLLLYVLADKEPRPGEHETFIKAQNDAPYLLSNLSQAPAFDRSPKNGFRCALYLDRGKIPAKEFERVSAVAAPDFHKQKPVPDSVFQVYKDQFSYDKKDLNAHVEWRNTSSADWVQEKITVDAAYGNEKLPMYLFVPKRSSPPYQTVIYFPGSPSIDQMSSKDLDSYREFDWHLSFIVKNGRAVLYPIYKGTFERRDGAIGAIYVGANTRQYTEYLIQLVQDFNRCVDYLETRPDVDSKRLAYLSFSWGSRIAPITLAVNGRLR